MSAPDATDRGTADDWRAHLLDRRDDIRRLLERTRRVAVLGIKPETHAYQPAFYVAEYAARAGLEVIPVPVYYPEVTEILGQRVYRRLADLPGELDVVDVFRRPHDIPPHLDDILAARPKAVWCPSGIRHAAAAGTLARAGIDVGQDRCLVIELRAIGR